MARFMEMKYKICSKTGLKYLTYEHILSYRPCYSPSKYLRPGWKGTAVDIIRMDHIPFGDRLWCVLRPELISNTTMCQFKAWVYKQNLQSVSNAKYRDTYQEIVDAAQSAAQSAAWDVTWDAAQVAAQSVAQSAAWSAAKDAIRDAAGYDARKAAEVFQMNKLIEMLKAEGKERLSKRNK